LGITAGYLQLQVAVVSFFLESPDDSEERRQGDDSLFTGSPGGKLPRKTSIGIKTWREPGQTSRYYTSLEENNKVQNANR